MELGTDGIIMVLSLVNNDLVAYVLATGVACEITCVGITELNNVPLVLGLPAQSTSVTKKPGCSD